MSIKPRALAVADSAGTVVANLPHAPRRLPPKIMVEMTVAGGACDGFCDLSADDVTGPFIECDPWPGAAGIVSWGRRDELARRLHFLR